MKQAHKHLMLQRARAAVFVAVMPDSPPPVEDGNFVPLSQSHYTWRAGRLVVDASAMAGTEHGEVVARLAAQHMRYEAFMPPSRSRSPPSVQARGCAQPVVSPASNPVTSRPQKHRAAGRRSVVQTPNVPVFVNSGAFVPVGQFDPALRLPGAPLQTPPRHLQGNMVAHPRDPNDVAAESALRSKFPEVGVDPGSSEKTTAASAWVMNVAAAWNLSPDAPRKTECPVSAVPMPSDQQQRAAQMSASSVAAPVEQPDDASDDDAALLAACVSLENKFHAARAVEASTQTEPCVAWPAATLPRWAWQAHACWNNQQCVQTCVRSAMEPDVFNRVSMAVPVNVRSAILHAAPYLPCFWFDINQAFLQMCSAANFLANLPPTVATESDVTSPCLHPRW